MPGLFVDIVEQRACKACLRGLFPGWCGGDFRFDDIRNFRLRSRRIFNRRRFFGKRFFRLLQMLLFDLLLLLMAPRSEFRPILFGGLPVLL